MLKRTEEYGRVFIAAIVITLTAPVVSIGSDLGHDWYCPDSTTHKQYTKHLKLHLDHGAEAITDVLAAIPVLGTNVLIWSILSASHPFAGKHSR